MIGCAARRRNRHRVMDVSHIMNPNNGFSILALDGGGVRGIYAARLLARIEDALDAKIKDCLDLIAGISTGSILTGTAATAILMTSIAELFGNEAPIIFRKRQYRCNIEGEVCVADGSTTTKTGEHRPCSSLVANATWAARF